MASDFSIRHAAFIVRQGGIIAYPTDTIYGLGCDPYNPDAVEKINRIKQRPLNKQFILLAADIRQLASLINIDAAQQQKILQATQPTSWVVPAAKRAPRWLVDRHNTLTIRITAQKDVKRLCHTLGHAIISTSANLSGKTPAKNSLQLHKHFHFQVDKIIVADRPLNARPSKIIRLCDNYVIRQ